MNNRRRVLRAGGAMLAAPWALQAGAQASSDRPIRLLVGFAPGGAVDSVARLLAVPMGEILGQSVIVENRPGASANIAAMNLVQSPADGLTVLMGALPEVRATVDTTTPAVQGGMADDLHQGIVLAMTRVDGLG